MYPSRWLLAFGAVLVLGTVLVFAPVRGHDFVDHGDFGDLRLVVENEHLREPLDLDWLAHNLTEIHHAHWIPLTWLSYRIDVALFGVEAPAMLTVNVLLHLGSVMLLWWTLGTATGAWGTSLFVTLLFALHPQRVESVAWASGRQDVLGGSFWMLGLLAYVRLPRNLRGDLAVGACFTLGLLADPLLIGFPLTLLLLDAWPLRRLGAGAGQRGFVALVVEKLPLFGLAIAASLILLQSQRLAGGMASSGALDAFAWTTQVGHGMVAVVQSLGDSSWPLRLSPFVPHPLRDPAPLAVLGSGLLLAVISAVAIRQSKQRPWLVVGWAWYLVNLLPALMLSDTGLRARADHWTYLPSIGLAILVGFTAAELAEKLAARFAPHRSQRLVSLALVLAVASTLALGARAQVHPWRNTETLFTHAIALDPDNWYAHHRLGKLRVEQERMDEARAHLLIALSQRPGLARAQSELGDVYRALGRHEAADALHENAARTSGGDAFADGRLGSVLVRTGETEAALPLLEAAVARDPDSGDLHAALALAHARQLDTERARAHVNRALRVAPVTADGRILLAWLLATSPEGELRNPEMARRALADFDAHDPHARADFLDALGATHAALGDFGSAYLLARRAADAAVAREHYELADGAEDRALLYLRHEPYFEARTSTR